jgi:hypothetical protein
MGTSFFSGAGKPKVLTGGGNAGQTARAIGQSGYAARSAGTAAQKGINQALSINKAGKFKPMSRSAAYPKGPKV